MISINKKLRNIAMIALTGTVVLSSCNKDVEQFTDTAVKANTSTTRTLGDTLSVIPRDSLFFKIILRAGLRDTLNRRNKTFTVFVPDSTAVKVALGIPTTTSNVAASAIIAGLPVATAVGLASYHILPQAFPTSSFPATYPNTFQPTLLNPAPTLSALLRFDLYLSARNGFWVNNFPLVASNIIAGNGVIHHTPAVLAPPQRAVWERLNTDAELTYFKAAVLRADQDPTAPGALVAAMNNIGANLTVFAPTDAATQPVLFGAIYQGLIAGGVPPATALTQATALASTPAGFNALPITTVKGIVVYHLMGVRAFTNNFPATATGGFPTLLNGGIPTHPGVTLQVTIGSLLTASATVKGVVNTTASNVIINPTPDATVSYGATPPAAPVVYTGKSDQNYTNAVFHKIDQVLLPQ